MNEMTIIHIPHASVYIPEEYKDSYRPKVLRHEIDVMTDWFCVSLFDCGAERIVSTQRPPCAKGAVSRTA